MQSEHFSAAEQAILAPYVTNFDRTVFALQHLPEEVVAVLFAYYSRGRESLRRNLLNLPRGQTARGPVLPEYSYQP